MSFEILASIREQETNYRLRVMATKGLSGLRLSAPAAPSGALAVAPGSLPVPSAEALCVVWETAAKIRDDMANELRSKGELDLSLENTADAYEHCAQQLRREIARATERQPEENK